MLTVLRPGMKFEDGVPKQSIAVRVRLRFTGGSPSHSIQLNPESELVSLQIDGNTVAPHAVIKQHDRYLIYELPDGHPKQAVAVVRDLASNQLQTLKVSLSLKQIPR